VKILIIDHPKSAEPLVEALRSLGHEVVTWWPEFISDGVVPDEGDDAEALVVDWYSLFSWARGPMLSRWAGRPIVVYSYREWWGPRVHPIAIGVNKLSHREEPIMLANLIIAIILHPIK